MSTPVEIPELFFGGGNAHSAPAPPGLAAPQTWQECSCLEVLALAVLYAYYTLPSNIYTAAPWPPQVLGPIFFFILNLKL